MTGPERTVLVVAAHPDDEVLGVGGTMARHARTGDDVHVLIVTEGTTQQYDDDVDVSVQQKERAARQCADRLGVSEVHFGGLPDMRLDEVAHVDVNAVIEDVIASVRPEVVYTHTPRDVNKDHAIVYESTLVTTRPPSGIERVLAYEVPSATGWNGGDRHGFTPNVYVDIAEFLETKVEAFESYDTEVREYPHPRSARALRSIARARGTEAGFEAAEAFSLVRERIRTP